MTLHALLAHLEELSRLKVHILYQRPIADSVACSTRSANDLFSPLTAANPAPATSVDTLGLKENVVITLFAICLKNFDEIPLKVKSNRRLVCPNPKNFLLTCSAKRWRNSRRGRERPSQY